MTSDPSLSLDRTGMLRQVSNIDAIPIPPEKYHSLNSATLMAGQQRSKAMTMGTKELLATLQKAQNTMEMSSPRSPKQETLDEHSMTVVKAGKARFKTPAPIRNQGTTEDPLRYLRQASKNDTVKDYIESSRKMLRSNIAMLEHQEEISKL